MTVGVGGKPATSDTQDKTSISRLYMAKMIDLDHFEQFNRGWKQVTD